MDQTLYHSLQLTCWIVASLAGVAAAWFKLRNAWQTEKQRERTLDAYARIWSNLDDLKARDIPFRAIRKSKEIIIHLADIVKRPYSLDLLGVNKNGRLNKLIVISAFIYAVLWMLGLQNNDLVIGFTFVFMAVMFLSIGSHKNWSPKVVRIKKTVGIIGAINGVRYIFWLADMESIEQSFYIASIMTPVMILYCASLALLFEKEEPGNIKFGEIALGTMLYPISVWLTIAACQLGIYLHPDSNIELNYFLISANLIHDFLTVLATLFLLNKAVRRDPKFPLPLAIFLDIATASIFAFTTLLRFSVRSFAHGVELGLNEISYYFIGLNSTGQFIELGPYFWVMHTTLIPTLLYMSVIFLAYCSKFIILPVSGLFYQHASVEKPHNLTAALFGFIGVITALIPGVLAFVFEKT